MLRAFDIPLTWRELLTRTIKEASADNVLGLAAQLAYYFLLALVPAIVFVAALASFVPGQTIDAMLQGMAMLRAGGCAGDSSASSCRTWRTATTAVCSHSVC